MLTSVKQLTLLLFLSLILLLADYSGFLNSFKKNFYQHFNPWQNTFWVFNLELKNKVFSFFPNPSCEQEKQILEKRIENFREQKLFIEELQWENEILREQLQLNKREGVNGTWVPVLGYSLNNEEELLIIQGEFRPGQISVLGRSLVGQVIAKSEGRSLIRTIYSPYLKVAAKIKNKNGDSEALVKGSFNQIIYGEKILATASINPGDLVVTAGSEGLFPPSLVLGEVIRTQPQGDLYQQVVIRPLWKREDLRSVFLWP